MRILCSTARNLLACFLLLVSAGAATADNWPRWRGRNNDGISSETGLPTEWGQGKNLAWSLALPGKSGATPAVWDDRLFLTSADGNNLVLMCVSTAGRELWKRTLGSGDRSFMRGEGNNASPSPSTDGQHVWAYTGTGDLGCFDLDGNLVWKFNVQDRHGKFQIMHGMHTTPLLDGDRLYLQLIHSGGAHVIALNKADGTEIWNVERKSDGTGENEHSYASPVMWRKGQDAYLITHGNDYAIAHRLDDGSEIWRVGGLNLKDAYRKDLRFVASPVATPDLIVVPSAKNHGVVGLRPDAKGLVMPGSEYELWRLKSDTPDVPSPLIYDGLVYLCRADTGFLTCLDAKTGTVHYSQRIHSSIYRASPVAAGGMVYLTAHDGTVTVVKAGPKFEQVAENKLPDDLAASPALSNGRIYLRGWKTLYAIGMPSR
jgi:outer membrane protein assembly factor BamB